MEAEVKTKKRGGKRVKAGRKPIADKKITIPIYPRLSRINLLGIEEIKDMAHAVIEKEYLKKQKIV